MQPVIAPAAEIDQDVDAERPRLARPSRRRQAGDVVPLGGDGAEAALPAQSLARRCARQTTGRSRAGPAPRTPAMVSQPTGCVFSAPDSSPSRSRRSGPARAAAAAGCAAGVAAARSRDRAQRRRVALGIDQRGAERAPGEVHLRRQLGRPARRRHALVLQAELHQRIGEVAQERRMLALLGHQGRQQVPRLARCGSAGSAWRRGCCAAHRSPAPARTARRNAARQRESGGRGPSSASASSTAGSRASGASVVATSSVDRRLRTAAEVQQHAARGRQHHVQRIARRRLGQPRQFRLRRAGGDRRLDAGAARGRASSGRSRCASAAAASAASGIAGASASASPARPTPPPAPARRAQQRSSSGSAPAASPRRRRSTPRPSSASSRFGLTASARS